MAGAWPFRSIRSATPFLMNYSVNDKNRQLRLAHSDGETDQKQTRSTPGQTKKMTNVLRNVIAIAIMPISGKGGVVDCAGPLRRRDHATLTRRINRVTASTDASQAQNNPTL